MTEQAQPEQPTATKREVLLERHKSWKRPEASSTSYKTGLKLLHSLWPIDPVEFIPVSGRRVNWYGCGPTVYSDTHLGHAYCYIVSDVLRRVFRDYFKYEVNYVMNITDIDDKIINKSIEEGVDFVKFARSWEKDYFENMKLLGVQAPNKITRVTEYVPEIVTFIEKIIANGYAYEANGSVYFSVDQFRKDGHHYCKLEPTSFNESNIDMEKNPEKKSPSDFALWKKVKEGEPSWPSPWGAGRPGWHIECSAMVNEAFDNTPVIDIHYGGSDLKFPHHDNELAQSEAFYKNDQWVNYFLHCGQLYIKGLKMSKSLKNYRTVRDILQHVSARELRLLFVKHQYDTILNFDPETSFTEINQKDSAFHNFNLEAQRFLRRGINLDNEQRFDAEEVAYEQELLKIQSANHEALCNNIATPVVIDNLSSLVKGMNIYMKRPADKVKTTLLLNNHRYIFDMLGLFGLDYLKDTSNSAGEERFNSVTDALTKFRDDVINLSGQKDPKAALFQLTDSLRDEVLPHQGIKIEDHGKGKPATWKAQDKDSLLAEIAAKKADQLKALQEKERKAKEIEDKQKREPRDIFNDADYKKWSIAKVDDKGIPTHNAKGEEFSAKVRGSFEKDYAKQEKSREEWLKKQASKTEQTIQE